MLSSIHRVMLLRPVMTAAISSTLSGVVSGAAPATPHAAATRSTRPARCVCSPAALHLQPLHLQQRCHLHHRSSATALPCTSAAAASHLARLQPSMGDGAATSLTHRLAGRSLLWPPSAASTDAAITFTLASITPRLFSSTPSSTATFLRNRRRRTLAAPPSVSSSEADPSALIAAAHPERHPSRQPTPTPAPPSQQPVTRQQQQQQPAQPHPTLTSGLGHVIAAASNFVRVELHTLVPDDVTTPPSWRPPHLRSKPAAASSPGSGAVAVADGTGSSSSSISSCGSTAAAEDPKLQDQPRPLLLLCSLRALLRKLRQDVVVGDVVRVGSIDWGQGRGVVSEVLPRSSRVTDPAVANVNHALLVFALDTPPFEEQQVSRFLVAYEAAGLPFTLVLNKADLVPPAVLQRRLEQCRSWGYEPVVLSCETGEGVEQVASVLQDRISVVAGPSGAGKSSLINSLRLGRHRPDLAAEPRDSVADAAEAEPLPVGGLQELVSLPPRVISSTARTDGSSGGSWSSSDVSEAGSLMEAEEEEGRSRSGSGGEGGGGSDGEEGKEGEDRPEFLVVGALSKMGRGMHTTTSIRLLRLLGGGWLADTPGFGQPTLEDISSQELGACFPEIAALTAEQPCRFSDCVHVAEPGCAVRDAKPERYLYYLRFLQEVTTREANDVRQLQRAKADREGYAKLKSVRGGGERLEARLDSKKHRRASRQSGKQAGRLVGELE